MIALLLALSGPAQAQDAEILMVGNSYTSRNGLPGLTGAWLAATVPAWDTVDALSSTAGGKTLPEHADDLGTDTALASYLVTSPRDFAFVTLQDQSQIPGFPTSEPVWQASQEAASELVDAVHATGAHPVFFQTWGRREGDAQNPDLYPDFSTMQDQLTHGYGAYHAGSTSWEIAATTAPVGEVFRSIHDSEAGDPAVEGTLFWELYSADGSHPSLAGTAVAAATFVAAWSGRVPQPLDLLTEQGLDAGRQQQLLDHVSAVVLEDIHSPNDYPWAHSILDWPIGARIHGDVQRPLVFSAPGSNPGTTNPRIRDTLTLGDGRLWISDELTVNGALSVEPGAPGEVALLAGTLRVGTLDAPVLDWRNGDLIVREAATPDLIIPKGGFLYLGGSPTVEVAGVVSGDGGIGPLSEVTDETLVLRALGGIDASQLKILVPNGFVSELRADGTELWWVPTGEAEEKGCGCATPPVAPHPAWALLVLLLARRRP